MNTVDRMIELADNRRLTLYGLSQKSDVPYSTLKNTVRRGGQLSVDTIERLCLGLGIQLKEFFDVGAVG